MELLQPYRGRVFDPCCGSGGMFVQSEKFIQAETTIRAGIVKNRLPECIILLPGKLFYTTPAPVCLWILSRDSAPRESKTLFIDASRIYTEVDRTHNKLTPTDIKRIAAVYHGWINKDGTYQDQPGFCKVVDK